MKNKKRQTVAVASSRSKGTAVEKTGGRGSVKYSTGAGTSFKSKPKTPELKKLKPISLDDFDMELFRRIATADENDLFEEMQENLHVVNKKKRYVYIDRGADILAVAHMDVVAEYSHFDTLQLEDELRIYSSKMDDRLGVYIILDLLPKMGIKADVLLTDEEETGKTSGEYFTTEKKYNWIVEFDRRGTDAVEYQYSMRTHLSKYFDFSHGSFSDISRMGHVGVQAFNVGIGYYNAHSKDSYCIVHELLDQLQRFQAFYEDYGKTRLEYTKPKASYGYGTGGSYACGGGGYRSSHGGNSYRYGNQYICRNNSGYAVKCHGCNAGLSNNPAARDAMQRPYCSQCMKNNYGICMVCKTPGHWLTNKDIVGDCVCNECISKCELCDELYVEALGTTIGVLGTSIEICPKCAGIYEDKSHDGIRDMLIQRGRRIVGQSTGVKYGSSIPFVEDLEDDVIHCRTCHSVFQSENGNIDGNTGEMTCPECHSIVDPVAGELGLSLQCDMCESLVPSECLGSIELKENSRSELWCPECIKAYKEIMRAELSPQKNSKTQETDEEANEKTKQEPARKAS